MLNSAEEECQCFALQAHGSVEAVSTELCEPLFTALSPVLVRGRGTQYGLDIYLLVLFVE